MQLIVAVLEAMENDGAALSAIEILLHPARPTKPATIQCGQFFASPPHTTLLTRAQLEGGCTALLLQRALLGVLRPSHTANYAEGPGDTACQLLAVLHTHLLESPELTAPLLLPLLRVCIPLASRHGPVQQLMQVSFKRVQCSRRVQ